MAKHVLELILVVEKNYFAEDSSPKLLNKTASGDSAIYTVTDWFLNRRRKRFKKERKDTFSNKSQVTDGSENSSCILFYTKTAFLSLCLCTVTQPKLPN